MATDEEIRIILPQRRVVLSDQTKVWVSPFRLEHTRRSSDLLLSLVPNVLQLQEGGAKAAAAIGEGLETVGELVGLACFPDEDDPAMKAAQTIPTGEDLVALFGVVMDVCVFREGAEGFFGRGLALMAKLNGAGPAAMLAADEPDEPTPEEAA